MKVTVEYVSGELAERLPEAVAQLEALAEEDARAPLCKAHPHEYERIRTRAGAEMYAAAQALAAERRRRLFKDVVRLLAGVSGAPEQS